MLTDNAIIDGFPVVKDDLGALQVSRVDDRGVFCLKVRMKGESLLRDVHVIAGLEGDNYGKRLIRSSHS